jgi:hypothetical protein
MIPNSTHPTWRKIITGEVKFEPEFLATKFLLSRLNSDYRLIGASTIDAGIRELISFFEKNQRIPKAQVDLKKIFGA